MPHKRVTSAVRRPSTDPAADFWQRLRVGAAVAAILLLVSLIF